MLRAAVPSTQISKMLEKPFPQKNCWQRLCFCAHKICQSKDSMLTIAPAVSKNLNVKHQNFNHFEENMANCLHDLGLRKNFVKTLKEYLFKEGLINYMMLILRNFAPQKTPQGKWKDNWEKLFKMCIFHKDYYAEYIVNSY